MNNLGRRLLGLVAGGRAPLSALGTALIAAALVLYCAFSLRNLLRLQRRFLVRRGWWPTPR